ncbi:MAG: glycoside hydrolase family 2 TIM barrel-domain containing protein [Eubacteriales bacterium]|nr:glycoside hydrolase family 2 TIM barrel-domain containing protein [Eubacteriales bacterium]
MILQKLTDWTLTGYHPYTPISGGMPVTASIPAVVPGSVYNDLHRAGIIEDPYYGMNSLACEWVANRWWTYETALTLDPRPDRRLWLILRGIDYRARIYLNGSEIGTHEGMYVPARYDVTKSALAGENRIKVIIEHAPDEMGQIGYTSQTHTQKARFTYKWDFSTRLVGMGLYDEVYIEETGSVRIKDVHVRYENGTLNCSVAAGGGVLEGALSYEGTEVGFETSERGFVSFDIAEPRLWYPNGYGDQPLYDLKLTLRSGGAISDERSMKVGLRTLTYERCLGAPADALPYAVSVNGRRVYIKGVNTTPLDCMYGIVGERRYEEFVKLAARGNVNLIRVWGGGLIEKEEFYDMCDRYGIMVWQEFIQSSSGIDNIPSKRPEFLALMVKTAEAVVPEKRNHVSLTFWSGGNELTDAAGVPSTYEDENIALLREIVARLDPDRLMLPTSASGPSAGLDITKPDANHDVHGPWKYGGTEEHYRMYNKSTSMLHSEFGCDGMSNMSSIVKALPPEDLRFDTVAGNLMWRFHGEWWDTYEYRDKKIFGEFAPPELEAFVGCSQFMQAEGLRYALEANRRRDINLPGREERDFRENCGSIVWQWGEPWRNVSCTCMVDYDNKPKAAYYAFREAMKGEHVSLSYDKLMWKRGETFSGRLYVHSDSATHIPSDAAARITDANGTVLAEVSGTFEFKTDIPGRTFTVECFLAGKPVNRYLFFITDGEHPYADREAALAFSFDF